MSRASVNVAKPSHFVLRLSVEGWLGYFSATLPKVKSSSIELRKPSFDIERSEIRRTSFVNDKRNTLITNGII